MGITAITPIVLRWPEPNDAGHGRMTVPVRVDTDAGIAGRGEGIAMWPEACRATAAIVTDGMAARLVGEDAGTWRATGGP